MCVRACVCACVRECVCFGPNLILKISNTSQKALITVFACQGNSRNMSSICYSDSQFYLQFLFTDSHLLEVFLVPNGS